MLTAFLCVASVVVVGLAMQASVIVLIFILDHFNQERNK